MISPSLTVLRVEDSYKWGTFGVLLMGHAVFCVTLEPHEMANRKNDSCIPPGQYECDRVVSPRHGTTYEVKDVPYRTDVLFHPGNRIIDTKGCIILAEKFGKLQGDRAVLNSGDTFKNFMNMMQPYPFFNLLIKETWA